MYCSLFLLNLQIYSFFAGVASTSAPWHIIPPGQRPKEFIFRKALRKTKFLRPSQCPRTLTVYVRNTALISQGQRPSKIIFRAARPKNQFSTAIATPPRTFSTTLIITFIIARRSPAAGEDLKRDLAGIPLLFVMRDDLKRDMAQIPLLFVFCLISAGPSQCPRAAVIPSAHCFYSIGLLPLKMRGA